jgi:hypothetical protein
MAPQYAGRLGSGFHPGWLLESGIMIEATTGSLNSHDEMTEGSRTLMVHLMYRDECFDRGGCHAAWTKSWKALSALLG